MYHGDVPGAISLRVIRDGIPQLVIDGTAPLPTGTSVHALFSFLPSRRFLEPVL